MDGLDNLEAGRVVLGLSLVGARAFGWLVLVELAKTPGEPLGCEGCVGGVMIRTERRMQILGHTFCPDGLGVRDEESRGGGLRSGDM